MSDVISRLKTKEEKLTNLRNQEERRQGRQDQLMQQLETDFQLTSVEAAVTLHQDLLKQLSQCDESLEQLDAEMEQILKAAQGVQECG